MANTSNTILNTDSSELTLPPAKPKSRVVKLSRVQQMVEVSLWTNRLDRRLKMRLADAQNELRAVIKGLKQLVKNSSPAADQAALFEALSRTAVLADEIVPEVTELSVVAADHIYLLDSLAADCLPRAQRAERRANALAVQLDLIRTSPTFRLAHYLLAPIRLLRSLLRGESFSPLVEFEEFSEANSALSTRAGQPRELSVNVTDFGAFNPHASVNNAGTGFEVFNNWNTFFRHGGKAFGSTAPSVTDHLDHITELHEIVSFTGKSVLELGPFEAGNTKQMLDLGAVKVVGIEANRDFYLKCCLVKNEFKLDGAEFLFGNCLEILEAQLTDTLRPQYDICVASGILYHFSDPIRAIDVITRSAPTVYVWTHVASEAQPKGPWSYIEDDAGHHYQVRENVYVAEQHWGGVHQNALWLGKADIQRAFTDRGYRLSNFQSGESHRGEFVAFIAERD